MKFNSDIKKILMEKQMTKLNNLICMLLLVLFTCMSNYLRVYHSDTMFIR